MTVPFFHTQPIKVNYNRAGRQQISDTLILSSNYVHEHMKKYASDQSRILMAELSQMNRRIFD